MEPLAEPAPQHDQSSTDHKPTSNTNSFATLIRQRWPEYVLEVVVIIVSITLSLAVDEWKETSRKQQVEQQYLKGLANDLTADLNQLQEVISETRQVVNKAKVLGKLSAQRASVEAAHRGILNDIRFVFKRPRFIAEEATFEELTSTGNMQLLSSYGLKAALFDYYKDYESIRLVEAAELESTNALAAPYLLKHLPLAEGSATPTLDLAGVMNELEFTNIMFVRYSTRQELFGDYEDLLKKGRHIQVLIRGQIK